MNLNEYLANKCLEKASVELAKQTILEDVAFYQIFYS